MRFDQSSQLYDAEGPPSATGPGAPTLPSKPDTWRLKDGSEAAE